MATAKSRSLSPVLHPRQRNLLNQIRNLWSHIVAVFIMEEPEEFAFHPDFDIHQNHKID
jgi:hypothetical protein